MFPKTTWVHRSDLHRLIPSQYSKDNGKTLAKLVESTEEADLLTEIANMTSVRVKAENSRARGLRGLIEVALLYGGLPYEHIINAAFLYPSPTGNRFNNTKRGAWYAAFEQQTSIAEVLYHKNLAYSQIQTFEDSVTYDDYLCDVNADLHDLQGEQFVDCLSPTSYVASQTISDTLLAQGSLGVLYPSVRDQGGSCVALFHPALVNRVRKGQTLRFTWIGTPNPAVTLEPN